jgi:hypothetical protein
MSNPWLEFDEATRERIREVYATWDRLTARPMRRWDEDVQDIGNMIQRLGGNGQLIAAVEQSVNGHMNRTGTVPSNFRYCMPAMRRACEDARKPRGPVAVGHNAPPLFRVDDMGQEPDGIAAHAAIAATLKQLGKEG